MCLNANASTHSLLPAGHLFSVKTCFWGFRPVFEVLTFFSVKWDVTKNHDVQLVWDPWHPLRTEILDLKKFDAKYLYKFSPVNHTLSQQWSLKTNFAWTWWIWAKTARLKFILTTMTCFKDITALYQEISVVQLASGSRYLMRHRDNGFPGVPIFHSKLKVCGVRMNFSIHVFVLLHQIQQTFVVWLHCCYSRPKIYRNLWHKNERNDTIEILEKLDVFEIFAPSIFFRAISPWTWSQENQGDRYGSLAVGV